MKFTLYRADCTGKRTNVFYRHEVVVNNAETLREAVKYDTVYARYRDYCRSNRNFIRSDVIPMDCDNEHTEDPAGWITPEQMSLRLSDVSYAIVPSRHNQVSKNGKAPRPKFHIFFPVAEITDAEVYADRKRCIHSIFPYLDSNAMDAARFFFGADAGPAIWHEGRRLITDVIDATADSVGTADSTAAVHAGNASAPPQSAIAPQSAAPECAVPQCAVAAHVSAVQNRTVALQSATPERAVPQSAVAAHVSAVQNRTAAPQSVANDRAAPQSTAAPQSAARTSTSPSGSSWNSQFGSNSASPASAAGIIPAGSRNSTLSRYAARVLKRFGITDQAYELFCREAARCAPPLEPAELKSIWSSALKFAERVIAQPDYVQPADFEAAREQQSLEPGDYSDVGQAAVLAREYGNELLYTDATGYLRYCGSVWVESGQAAVGAMEEFLDLQLQDALNLVQRTRHALLESGVSEEVIAAGGKTLDKAVGGSVQRNSLEAFLDAQNYVRFVLKRRDMKYVSAALQAARPMLEVKVSDLDRDGFLLNTTDGTYDLRQGMEGRKDHDPKDFITRQTCCAPGEQGRQLWLDALELFFSGDESLIDYVQRIVGLSAIGRVYAEALIIAYGDGRNGKSTFWNTIASVLGNYSGRISADLLTAGCRRNARPEMAELKGKRLIIAAELEEGMRLNTSVIKQLCSTDEITAEKKYRDPFKFVPSHTLVLYTNHLPRVGASDAGTWRRLIVIPFNAVITGSSDIRNYTDYLVKHAGPYILQWIIEGAQKVIAEHFNLTLPQVVQDAVSGYREDNDWLASFLEHCCEVGSGKCEKSGALYDSYRTYCARTGEYTRSTTDFYAALLAAGCEKKKTRTGRYILGLSLKSEFQ